MVARGENRRMIIVTMEDLDTRPHAIIELIKLAAA